MKKLAAGNYPKDKLYPAVGRAIAEVLKRGEFVSPVEVLLQMQRITKQQFGDWRFGRIALRKQGLIPKRCPTFHTTAPASAQSLVL